MLTGAQLNTATPSGNVPSRVKAAIWFLSVPVITIFGPPPLARHGPR